MATLRVFRAAPLPSLTTIAALALTFGLFAAVPARRASAQAEEPRVIDVTASRFAFEPATIDVVVGERVRLAIKSADGAHGFEIKKFKVKKEIPRGGVPIDVEFTATAAGSFPILCSEYCGNGHARMTGTLVVRAAEDPSP